MATTQNGTMTDFPLEWKENTMSPTRKHRRPSVPLAIIVHRSAMPLFLFSLVFLLLLVLTSLFLIPRVTTVEIAGKSRDAQELQSYHVALLEELAAKERQRDALVLPMADTAYSRLLQKKNAEFPFPVLRSSIEQAIRRLLPEARSAVFLESTLYFPETRSIELAGDVRNVGSRSMTVLAQLVEELRVLPFVSDIVRPRFTREDDPVIGLHSPFTFRIKLL